MTATTTRIELQLTAGAGLVSQLLSANERGHWALREARRRYWLDLTAYRLHGLHRVFTDTDHVHVLITIAWPDRRRRDIGNYQPTAKVILDAAVRAGVIHDDSDRYLTGPDLRRGHGPHEVRIAITKTGDAA